MSFLCDCFGLNKNKKKRRGSSSSNKNNKSDSRTIATINNEDQSSNNNDQILATTKTTPTHRHSPSLQLSDDKRQPLLFYEYHSLPPPSPPKQRVVVVKNNNTTKTTTQSTTNTSTGNSTSNSYEPPIIIPTIHIDNSPLFTSRPPKALPTVPRHQRAVLDEKRVLQQNQQKQQQLQIFNFQKAFEVNSSSSHLEATNNSMQIFNKDYQHHYKGSTNNNEDGYEQLSSHDDDEVISPPQIALVVPKQQEQHTHHTTMDFSIPTIVIEPADDEQTHKEDGDNGKEDDYQSPPHFQILPNSLTPEQSTSPPNSSGYPHLLTPSQLEVVSTAEDIDLYSHEEYEDYYVDDQTEDILDMGSMEQQDDDDLNLSSRTVSPPEWNLDQIEDFDDDEFFMDEEDLAVIDSLDTTIFQIEGKSNLELDYKRIRLIKELKKTELNYLKTLSTFQIYYINPLREMKQAIVAKDFLQKAVSEMGVLSRVNKMFYDRLDLIIDIPETDEESVLYEYCKNRANYSMEIELAKEITKFGHTLKLYIGYISKYKSSIEQLNIEKKKNKKFQRYLQEVFLNIAKDGLIPSPPSSYLIAPIQRIPRYQLLLSEIVKCSKHLPDIHQLLEKATEEVVSVAEYCNEKEREIQNMDKMQMLSNKFRNKMIIHPARKFICEAVFDFKKKARSGNVTLYLFSDILLVVEKGIVQKSKMIPFDPEKPFNIEDHGETKFLMQGKNKIYTLIPKKTNDRAQTEFFLAFSNLLSGNVVDKK